MDPGSRVASRRIRARRVHFDWSGTPLHWIPGDPFTTHVINVLHLLLPAGERWFCGVYRQALPLVTDPQIREDVRGFIGQEAVHSRAHAVVLEHLSAQGIDSRPYTRRVEWMFDRLLGDRPFGVAPKFPVLERSWLSWRLAVIAAVEHFTCVLGSWVIDRSAALDEARADPTMLDLLRWHGAEEVEHRAVAYDLFQHLSGSYFKRVMAMGLVFPVLGWLWYRGAAFLLQSDPIAPRGKRAGLRTFVKRSRAGRLPTLESLGYAALRFLRPRHHPRGEGSTDRAVAYLASSPALVGYGRRRG